MMTISIMDCFTTVYVSVNLRITKVADIGVKTDWLKVEVGMPRHTNALGVVGKDHRSLDI